MTESFKKHKWKIIIPVVLILLGLVFRFSILRAVGNFLIKIDEPQKSEIIYVLGGNSKDRGEKAAELYNANFSNEVVCIGGNWHDVLEYYGITTLESEVAQKIVVDNGVPINKTRLIKESTSTLEEKQHILNDIKTHNYKSVIVVTDKFHSRRVRGLFEDELEELDVQFTLVGVNSSKYDENEWWNEERGLIMVNNEYMKSILYFLKY